MNTFWSTLDDNPPILIRLIAKEHGKPLSTKVICDRSGLPQFAVETISHALDWTGIDLPTMRKFLDACGVDLFDWRQANRRKSYMRDPRWRHLRRSKEWRTYYDPMLTSFRENWIKPRMLAELEERQ